MRRCTVIEGAIAVVVTEVELCCTALFAAVAQPAQHAGLCALEVLVRPDGALLTCVAGRCPLRGDRQAEAQGARAVIGRRAAGAVGISRISILAVGCGIAALALVLCWGVGKLGDGTCLAQSVAEGGLGVAQSTRQARESRMLRRFKAATDVELRDVQHSKLACCLCCIASSVDFDFMCNLVLTHVCPPLQWLSYPSASRV